MGTRISAPSLKPTLAKYAQLLPIARHTLDPRLTDSSSGYFFQHKLKLDSLTFSDGAEKETRVRHGLADRQRLLQPTYCLTGSTLVWAEDYSGLRASWRGGDLSGVGGCTRWRSKGKRKKGASTSPKADRDVYTTFVKRIKIEPCL